MFNDKSINVKSHTFQNMISNYIINIIIIIMIINYNYNQIILFDV